MPWVVQRTGSSFLLFLLQRQHFGSEAALLPLRSDQALLLHDPLPLGRGSFLSPHKTEQLFSLHHSCSIFQGSPSITQSQLLKAVSPSFSRKCAIINQSPTNFPSTTRGVGVAVSRTGGPYVISRGSAGEEASTASGHCNMLHTEPLTD